jgi:hypothetical protein
MAAVELLEIDEFVSAPYLRLVSVPEIRAYRVGQNVHQRRATRARVQRNRRRLAAGVVLAAALTVLALPGHVFGATTGAGLSTDLAGSSTLASGMNYVVQPGDTVNSIASDMNPVNPAPARAELVRELGSSTVVPGEHVLIP